MFRFLALAGVGLVALALLPTPKPLPLDGERLTAGGTSRYVAMAPVRILDTRPQSGVPNLGYTTPFGSQATRPVMVYGLHVNAEAGSAVAAVLNVTVADTTDAGFLTLYPQGMARPTASAMNWSAGDVKANLTQVELGTNDEIDVFNGGAGSVDVLIDVVGYYYAARTVGYAEGDLSGLYHPLDPARIEDTRSGLGPIPAALGPGQTVTVQLTGLGPIPPSGVAALAINVTVTDTSSAGYLEIWPAGRARPTASNLNWSPGHTVANRAIVALSGTGAVSIYNAQGSVDVVLDANGWFTDGTTTALAYGMVPIPPTRVFDTRGQYQVGPYGAPMANGETRTLQVAGKGTIPLMADQFPPVAVVANITVTDTAGGDSYLSAYPDGLARPNVSDLNWSPGQTTSNLAVLPLGADGAVKMFNANWCADVVIDVLGYFAGPAAASPAPPAAASPIPDCYLPPPPRAPFPTRLRIPSIGVNANVEQVGVDGAGNIAGPASIWDVGWFEPGPVPGENGDAIMDGHVNWYNSATAVFTNLSSVSIGAPIYVDRVDGSTVTFIVDSEANYPAGAAPDWLFTRSAPAQLSLITCSGYWNGAEYTQRLIVHSHAA